MIPGAAPAIAARAFLPALALLVLAPLLSGCPGKHDGESDRLKQELGLRVPLWVEIECRNGKPIYKDYSVLKLPDERVQWALVRLDGSCRVYGALVAKGVKKPDMCDIRFRSRQELVGATGRCACVAGHYDLEEGRPTSQRCCEKFPDKPYCKPVIEPDVSPELPPDPLPEAEPDDDSLPPRW